MATPNAPKNGAPVIMMPKRKNDPVKKRNDSILDRFQYAHDHHRKLQPLLVQRMAFYIGNHYGIFTDPTVRERAGTDPRLSFEVYNHIRPGIKTVVQQRMQFFPRPRVLPRGTATKDIAMATITERLLRGMASGGPLTKRTLWNCIAAAEIYGWSFLKTYWNPLPHGHKPPGPQFDYCSPLDVILDPAATSWSEVQQGYIFHRKILPIRVLKSQYTQTTTGDDPSFEAPSDDTIKKTAVYDFADQMGEDGLGEVIEMWEFPNEENDYNGRLVTFSGSQFFHDVPLPYRVPFRLISGSNKNPENQYPDGAAADAVPINLSKNKTESILKEQLVLTSNPAVLTPRQAKIKQGAFVAVGGQRIEYDGPWTPTWFFGPGPSANAIGLANHQRDELEAVMGTAAVLRGQTAPTNQPARQTAYQKELFNEQNADDNAIFEEEIQDVMRQYLWLLHDYAQDGTYIPALGTDNKPALQYFLAEQIDFDPYITIEHDDGPSSKMARIDLAIQMLSSGFFNDTPEAKRAREFAKLASDEGPGNDIYEINYQRAQQEEQEFLLTGNIPRVLPQEIEEAHLDSHVRFVNGQDFLALPPEQQQAFLLQHLQPTQQQLQSKMPPSESGQPAQQAPPEQPSTGSPGGRPPTQEGVTTESMTEEPTVNQDQLP